MAAQEERQLVLVAITTISGGQRIRPKLVSVRSFHELLQKSQTQLNLDMHTQLTAIVEKGEFQGFEVADDDVLGLVSKGQGPLEVCVLPQGIEWFAPASYGQAALRAQAQVPPVPALQQAPAAEGAGFEPRVLAENNGPAGIGGENIIILDEMNIFQPQEPAMLLPSMNRIGLSMTIISKKLDKILEDINKIPQQPDLQARINRVKTEVASQLADQLADMQEYSLGAARAYSAALLAYGNRKYEKVFGTYLNGALISDGLGWFVAKVNTNQGYRKNKNNLQKKRGPRRRVENADDERPRGRAKRHCCPQYLVPLPPGEEPADQERKRLLLAESVNSDLPDINGNLQLILQTYPTLRAEIGGCKDVASVKDMLQRWPLFHHGVYLLHHGSILCKPEGIDGQWDCLRVWETNIEKLWQPIFNFMESHWKDEARSRKATKRAKLAPAMLTLIEAAKRQAVEDRSDRPKIIAIFELICNYFKEDFSFFLVSVESDASQETIIEAVKGANLNPIVVVKGNILNETAAVHVRIFETYVISAPDVTHAILTAFMAFMTLDFCYTRECQSFLEFMQRLFLNLNGEGDRREVERRNASPVDTNVLALANAIRDHSCPFNL